MGISEVGRTASAVFQAPGYALSMHHFIWRLLHVPVEPRQHPLLTESQVLGRGRVKPVVWGSTQGVALGWLVLVLGQLRRFLPHTLLPFGPDSRSSSA